MAKHYVIDFSLERIIDEKNVERLIVEIKTEIRKKFKYELTPDTRQPTIDFMENNLRNGLTFAKENSIKIDISEYLERMYIFIDLPNVDTLASQYTARKVD